MERGQKNILSHFRKGGKCSSIVVAPAPPILRWSIGDRTYFFLLYVDNDHTAHHGFEYWPVKCVMRLEDREKAIFFRSKSIAWIFLCPIWSVSWFIHHHFVPILYTEAAPVQIYSQKYDAAEFAVVQSRSSPHALAFGSDCNISNGYGLSTILASWKTLVKLGNSLP